MINFFVDNDAVGWMVDIDVEALVEGWKVGIPRENAVLLIGIGIDCIRNDDGGLLSTVMEFPIVTIQRKHDRNNHIICTIPTTVNTDLLLLFLPYMKED